MKAILAVMVPLLVTAFTAQTCYYKATSANDDAAHDEKLRQLMFSSLPTKTEVQAHWAAQEVQEQEVYRRLALIEQREREDALSIARHEGCEAQKSR